jgi:hypothetical protein
MLGAQACARLVRGYDASRTCVVPVSYAGGPHFGRKWPVSRPSRRLDTDGPLARIIPAGLGCTILAHVRSPAPILVQLLIGGLRAFEFRPIRASCRSWRATITLPCFIMLVPPSRPGMRSAAVEAAAQEGDTSRRDTECAPCATELPTNSQTPGVKSDPTLGRSSLDT